MKRWMAGILVLLMAGLVPFDGSAYKFGTAWDESFYNPGSSEWHGKPTDHLYLADERDRGMELRNVYFRWNSYQTGPSTWNDDYLNQKKAEIKHFQNAGFSIVLRVNPFPVPDWYLAGSHVRPKNQHGKEWRPDVDVPQLLAQVAAANGLTLPQDQDQANQIMKAQYHVDYMEKDNSQVSLWDPNYQAAACAYIHKVLTELEADPGIAVNDFWAVYISAGQFGEVAYPGRNPVRRSLRYGGAMPPADTSLDGLGVDYDRHWNCYWAFDANAAADCPVPAFVPATQAGVGQRLWNGDFEDTRYPDTVANWTSSRSCFNQGGISPTVIHDSGQAAEGSRYLRFASLNGSQYYLRQEAPIRPGVNYALSGYIRAVSTGATGSIKITQADANGNPLGTPLVLSSSQAAWTQVSQSFVSDAGAAMALVDVYVTGANGAVEYDGLSLLDTANPTADHSAAEAFVNWYYQRLAHAAKWQIQELRGHYNGRLILMGGGDASRPGDVEMEINNDLSGKTKNGYWVSRGFAIDRYLEYLKNDPQIDLSNVSFANTGVEVVWNDWENADRVNGAAWNTSSLKGDWSAPKYYAETARTIWGAGTKLYCENGGSNNTDQMQDVFQNLQNFNYEGLGWYTLGQLFEPYRGANIQDYANRIATANGLPAKPATGAGILPVHTGWELDQPAGYDNIFNSKYNVESYDSAEFGLPLCTRAWQGNKGVNTRSGNNYLVVAGKASDNASNPNCYKWLFNDVLIPYHNVTITSGTKLRYWIYPHDDSADSEDGNRCVAVDLIFSDGTALRDHSTPGGLSPQLLDQNGHYVHPAQRQDYLTPNAWNYVEVDLSAMAGRTVKQVWVAFDDPNYLSHGRKYRAYIDDLRFDAPPAAYDEEFAGPADVRPRGWSEGGSGITMRGNGAGAATATLVSGTYGSVESPVIVDYDHNTYDTLEFKINSLSPGAFLEFGLQQLHQGSRGYMWDGLGDFNFMNVPGVYRVRLNKIAQGADLTAFSAKFWLKKAAGHAAAFDYVKLVQHPPVPVVTPTADGWADEFIGAADETPAGWRDRKAWGEHNAQIEQNGGGQAVIRLGFADGGEIKTADTYGGLMTPVIENLDIATFPIVEFKIKAMDLDRLDVSVNEQAGDYRQYNGVSASAPGIYTIDLRNAVAQGANLSRFALKFWPNDASKIGSATLEYVRVRRAVPVHPEMNYGSYFGGNGQDRIRAMRLDPQGNIYLVGETSSTSGLPFTPGSDSTLEGESDAFIAKLSPDGKTVIYCTLLGGNSRDYAEGVVTDMNGNAYVTGATWSNEHFPTTLNALSGSLGGGRDAFVAKLDADGRLKYCTYLGGSNWDYGFCIDATDENTVYVGGFTHGAFPVTANVAQSDFGGLGDGFVTKLKWTAYATDMVYSTYVGGQYWESVSAIKVRSGRAHIVTDTQSPDFPITPLALDKVNTVPYANGGGDGSFSVLSQTGSDFTYSTFLGAEDSPAGTAYHDIALSQDGATVYLVGCTNEPHFQATSNAFQSALGGGHDGVLVKLNRITLGEYSLAYSTFMGGEGEEAATSALVDAAGNLWVSGYTTSAYFPDNTIATGGCDLFTLYLDGDCNFLEGRRYGGSADDGTAGESAQRSVKADTLKTGSDSIWLAGFTASTDFPKTDDARQAAHGGVLDAFTLNCARPDYGTMTILPTPTPTPSHPAPPEILYASYLGLSYNDRVQDIHTDANGYVYVVGSTTSVGLATPNAYDRTFNSVEDAFLAKFDPSGHLLFLTYLGGSNCDGARGVATDASGNIYVTGATWSADFPTTANALDRTLGGGRDAFVAKFSPEGNQLLYCTYLGGLTWDYGHCIDTDAENTVYVGGFTHGSFPVTTGAAQTNFGGLGDGFVVKLAWNSSATTQLFGTYAGGCYWESVSDLKVRNGQVYAAGGTQSPDFPTTANAVDRVNTVSGPNYGGDGFFSILSADGTQWVYSTFYGSENSPLSSGFHALEVVGEGDVVYLTGNSSETGFQTTAGACQRNFGGGTNDGVLVKFVKNTGGYDLGFSTFLGGDGDDLATDVTCDTAGKVWVTGITDSSGFPADSQPLGEKDLFIAYLNEAGQLLWTGRYGGSSAEGENNNGLSARAALGGSDSLFIAGLTRSYDFPTTPDADQGTYGGNYLIKLAKPTSYLPPAPTPVPTPVTFWMEGFNGQAGQQPANWLDESQDSSFNCELDYATQTSEAIITRTQDSTWGKVQSPVLTCDVDQYPLIELQVTAMDAGTVCRLSIQEEGGAWQTYNAGSTNITGTRVYNLQTATGWTGSHSFRIQVVVEGVGGKTIRLGGLRVFQGVPQTDAWVDDLGGTTGQKPAGWWDESNDPAMNVVMSYGPADSQAQLVRTSEDTWGKVVSPYFSCDVTANPMVEVVIDQVDPDTTWKLGVMKNDQHWILTDSLATTGTVSCNYAQVTGWSGVNWFRVILFVEGAAGKKVVVNRVRVTAAEVEPVPVPTPTSDTYREDFLGTAGAQPTGWQDESNQSAYNAQIAYSCTTSLAAITRTAEDSWGKVLSPVIHADASAFPVLELRVASVTPDTCWKVGIQEVNGAWRYWDMNTSTTGAGIFAFDYAAATGWNGEHDFRIQVTVEGAAGKGLELDWVRVCGGSAVHGAAVRGRFKATKQPTSGTNPELQPMASPTAMPTPWLEADVVKAYPNPARDHVNFAYTVSGSVSVTIDVYRLTGERVARIQEDRDAGSGQTLTTVWNTQDVAAGIYFYRLEVKAADGGTILGKKQKLAIVK